MGNKSYLILSGILLLSILFWSACNNPGSSLEESVKPYLELQAVDGASNVTVTVNRGAAKGLDSYFAVDFTNFESNGIISEGLTEGWCLDYQKPIDQNNDVHEGIKMFNTFGSENWKPANYLMNIKNELKQNDPSLTYKEIQVALWSLIEVPAFNIDKVLAEGSMPSRLMTNGTPNFNIEKTKGIINKVRNEVDDFVYKPGTPVIVYSNTIVDDHQDMGTVTCTGFRTQTQGGWSNTAAGNNPGSYRDANFDKAFPDGLEVGGIYTISLTTPQAVQAFLPSGGQPSALSRNYTDPTQGLGAFAGNVVALSLSIGFDGCTVCEDFGTNVFPLKDLIFQDGDFTGMTVEEVLTEANRVLGGGIVRDYSVTQLNGALDAVNKNYKDGNPAADANLLGCTSNIVG